MHQFFAHLRADKLGAPERHGRIAGLERGNDLFALLGRGHTLLHGQADHHVARGTEVLHLHISVAEARNRLAHLRQFGRLAVSHFHDRAARELHRQVQATREQEEHGQRKGDEGDRVENQRVLHERDVFSDTEKLHDF